MDHVEEHYENLEKSIFELRCFFEERGYEIEIDSKIEVASRTIKYSMLCEKFIFKSSVTLMKDYSSLNSIWDCYKNVGDHYEWIDSDRLETLVKLLYT